MRRLTLAFLGLVLLSFASAALAVEPAAADLAAPASVAAPQVTSPAPLDLFVVNPQPVSSAFNLCPPEPVVTCESCFLFGVTYSLQCTFYCTSSGVPHRNCTPCGSGCPL